MTFGHLFKKNKVLIIHFLPIIFIWNFYRVFGAERISFVYCCYNWMNIVGIPLHGQNVGAKQAFRTIQSKKWRHNCISGSKIIKTIQLGSKKYRIKIPKTVENMDIFIGILKAIWNPFSPDFEWSISLDRLCKKLSE